MSDRVISVSVFLAIFLFTAMVHQGPLAGQEVFWTNPDGGSWFDGNNWDVGGNPSAQNDVFVDLQFFAPYRIDLAGRAEAQNLTLDSESATLVVSNRGLFVDDLLDVASGILELENHGRVSARQINLREDGLKLNRAAYFERSLISGGFTAFKNHLTLTNGASVNGRVTLRNNSTLRFNADNATSSHTLDDTFVLLSNSSLLAQDGMEMTLGSKGTVAAVGNVGATGNSTFINEGKVFASATGKRLNLLTGMPVESDPNSGQFINRGLMEARKGGVLTLGYSNANNQAKFVNDKTGRIVVQNGSQAKLLRNWESLGQIDVKSGGHLTIGSSFTSEDVHTITPRVGSRVLVQNAVWNNQGMSYTFGNRAKMFGFDGATISGGMLNFETSRLNVGGVLSFEQAELRGDIAIHQSAASVSLLDSHLTGNISLNAGSLELRRSQIDGRLAVSNGGIWLDEGVTVRDHILVDGEEAFVKSSTTLGEQPTSIHLANGGQAFHGGYAISGNGMLHIWNSSGTSFSLNGPVEAKVENEHPTSRNNGQIFLHNGAILNTVRRGEDGGFLPTSTKFFFNETDGEITLNNGVIKAEDGRWIRFRNYGTIRGNGNFEGHLSFWGGLLSPGIEDGEIGELNILGQMTSGKVVGDDSRLVFDVAFGANGNVEHDRLNVYGGLKRTTHAEFGADLEIRTWGDISAEDLALLELKIIDVEYFDLSPFENVENGGWLTSVDNRFQFQVNFGPHSQYDVSSVVLNNFRFNNFNFSTVPEPNSVTFIFFAGCVATARRKKTILNSKRRDTQRLRHHRLRRPVL